VDADRKSPRHVATLENAYRVANKLADANDQDMQVAATGEAERPFVAEPANDRSSGVVARILAG
jgi:hypothetical protein